MKKTTSLLLISAFSAFFYQAQASQLPFQLQLVPKTSQEIQVPNFGKMLPPSCLSKNELEIKALVAKTPENMKMKEYANKYLIELINVDTSLTRLLPNNRKLELNFSMAPKEKVKDNGLSLEEFTTLRDALEHFKENLFFVLTRESNLTMENEKLKKESSQNFNEEEEEGEETLKVYREFLDSYLNANENTTYSQENPFIDLIKKIVKPEDLQKPIKTKIKRGLKRKAEEFEDITAAKKQKLMLANWINSAETVDYTLTYKNPLNFGNTTVKFSISKLEEKPENISYLTGQLDKLITENFANLVFRNIQNVINEINRAASKQPQNESRIYT